MSFYCFISKFMKTIHNTFHGNDHKDPFSNLHICIHFKYLKLKHMINTERNNYGFYHYQ